MRINWGSQLETGVRAIDLQHEELIEILNDLDAACAGNGSGNPTLLEDVLSRLNTYILFHFGTEEALMADLHQAASHVEAHMQQHRAFVAYIAGMRETAQQDGPAALVSLLTYLQEWLIQHILQTDRTLAGLLGGASARH